MDDIKYIGTKEIEGGEGSHNFYAGTASNIEEMMKNAVEGLGVGTCGHEYDCCGCAIYSEPELIFFDEIHRYYVIRQTVRRNV
jgi:hypothetical protein